MVTYSHEAPPALHRYACIRCRQRKVKCDKKLAGCVNCKRYNVECIFSARRPRTKQKLYPETTLSMPVHLASQEQFIQKYDSLGTEEIGSDEFEDEEYEWEGDEDDYRAIVSWSLQNQPYEWSGSVTETSQGRLTTDVNGKSHFINSDRAAQVSYLETAFASDSAGALPASAKRNPISTNRCEHLDANSLLTTVRNDGNLRAFYPPLELIPRLWNHYTLHVDIMFKVLFKPDVARLIHDASSGLQVDTSDETLLFAIIYAVLASSSPDDCRTLYGAERKQLLRKYRIALERALASAGWMATQEMVVLQSLAIYLAFTSEKSRSTWVLSGMIISLAQAMGLHTNMAPSLLTAVEIEVRRRVWWSICQIDVRVSSACGLESHVPLVVDSRLPLHINDADLEMEKNIEAILPRNEKTEMTLTLIKVEMAYTTLKYTRSEYKASPAEKLDLAREQIHRFSNFYSRFFEDSSDFSRLCVLGLRCLMVRLRELLVKDAERPVDTGGYNEHLMLYNADVLEIALQMPQRKRQYGWFFRCKCSQWHALIYLLTNLCKHTQGAAVDRAWESVNTFFSSLEQTHDLAASRFFEGTMAGKRNALWQPLLRLLDKARNLRAQAYTETSSTSYTPGTTSDESEIAPGNDHFTGMYSNQEGMLADPFLGQSFEFEEEMNWEQVDVWAHDFQAVLTQDYGTGDTTDNMRDDNLKELYW